MSRYIREFSVALAYLLLLLILAIFARSFYQGDKPRALLVSSAPVLVAVVGMTLVIQSRNIDISIGSQFSLRRHGGAVGTGGRADAAQSRLGTVLAGGLLGAVNGALIGWLGLPSIVVALATLAIYPQWLLRWQEGAFVKNLPPDVQRFGFGQDRGQWVIVAASLTVFDVFAWAMRYLAAGRTVYATGSHPEAARLAGMQPRRVVFTVFAVMGALAGFAALLSAAQFPQVDPKGGEGLEMEVIAAVVVGGVAISGGRGTLIGPLLGLALLGTIGAALVFLGVQPYWEKAIQGGIILVAVATSSCTPGRGVWGEGQ